MKIRLRIFTQKAASVLKKAPDQSQGVALILTLMILLTFVLLGLALLLHTDTEYVIAVNEQDSLETFHYAEAGLNWAKRKIMDEANESTFVTFSDLLNGVDNASAADDFLLSMRPIDAGLTETTDLVLGNEQTNSVIVTRDFGDGSKTYEAFRRGIDQDGDSVWDGPRALVYVRVDDNYDEYPNANAPLLDTDRTVIATVVAEAPIFVDSGGVYTPGTRTVARRHLRARFGPGTAQPAILARRSLLIQGNPSACGDCGSVHANQNIYGGGNVSVCQDLTSTNDPIAFDDDGSVIGDEFGGGFDEIEVPVINPYRDEMVPEPGDFATSFNFNSAGCGSSTPKYYAFVSNTDKGLVFKAVWVTSGRPDHPQGAGWKWKLIDDLNDGNNTMLDDCGRVVCGTVNGVSVHEVGDGVCNAGENWLNDDKTEEFYGFKQNDALTSLTNCTGDISLCDAGEGCALEDNDYNTVNFYCSAPNTFCSADNTINTGFRLLPGAFDKDGVRDFADSRFEDDKARWIFSGDLTYSPVFNALVWIYGQLEISGNPGKATAKICTSASSGALNKKCEMSDSPLLSTVDAFWRISFITVGSAKIGGDPKYSTATPEFPFLLVAGRDVHIGGSPSTSTTICNRSADECAVNLGNSAEFAGIIAAHEQVKFSGNFDFDGFIIVEDAVDCSTNQATRQSSTGQPIDLSGDFNIHYDCLHPPNPFADNVKTLSWQEVQ